METNADYADSLKTPRRLRRTSTTPLEPISQNKRSTRKTIMPEIDEIESVASDPVTPSRSARILDFQTPSRSESVTMAQTPRRSVRKSIKPVQEYENIVAQKGLSAKRVASSSIEAEEESVEGKWAPSVIGRGSTKRNKKARRAKNKQLKRQQRVVEEGVEKDIVDVKVDHNQLNDDNEKMLDDADCGQGNSKECGVALNENEKIHDNHLEEDQEQSNEDPVAKEIVDEADHRNENEKLTEEKQSIAESPSQDDKEDKIICASKDRENNEGNKGEIEANEDASKEVGTHKDENTDDEDSNSSMEGGDIEMATMPITADDMESPVKPLHLSKTETNTNFSVVTVADSVNKSNDSDCIMLENSQTEQSDSCASNSKLIHDSCDSLETNMPPLMMCSDDEDIEDIVDAPITPNQTKKPEVEKLSAPKNEITSLDGTFEIESPAKKTGPITPQIPMVRSSITRKATPFKSRKAIVPDIIIEPEEELDSEKISEDVLKSRGITLKSSRKRSFSICTDRPKKFVTFHSPANTTVSIYDGDLMKSTTKEDTDNVTHRRKRSLSVTETDKEVMAYFEQKETTESTPDKRRKVAQPHSRTKMPNFSAIHQQQFQRMESISDHVARKAERAKVILSASKVRPASIQKGLPVKNSVLRENNKDAGGNKVVLPMPKVRQRIELFGIEHKSKIEINKTFHSGMKVYSKSKPDLSTFDDFPSIGKISTKTNANTSVFTASAKPVHLPRPRFDTNVSTLNAPLNSNKLGDRRKRMMDMYKGRTDHRTGEKNKEILKGVRTNRRFELQMMCRNRQN